MARFNRIRATSSVGGISPGTFVSTFGSVRVAVARRTFLRFFAISARFAHRLDCLALREPIRWHLRTTLSSIIQQVRRPTELCINSTRHAARPTEDWPGRRCCFELRNWCYEDSAGSPPVLKCTRPLQPCLCHPDFRYVFAAGTNWFTQHSRPCPRAPHNLPSLVSHTLPLRTSLNS